MSATAVEPAHDLRGLLQIVPFRRLWISLGFASLGDWLSFLAAAALAHELTGGVGGSYAQQNLAIGGVFLVRLLPAVLIGPIAGAVADRLDRRWTMIICALARAALLISIPLVDSLVWLFIAIFMIEVASLFWIPAKEATMPNLVPRSRLEAANQLSLVTTYGMAPVAAALFVLLTLFTGSTARFLPFFARNPVDFAFYINALTFVFSAITVWRLTEIPKTTDHVEHPSMVRTVLDGWRFIFGTPMLRGLVVGMLGAFAAGGVVIGLARTFVTDLGAGDPGFGVLFGTVFVGLATGMFVGPRLLSGFSRRRLFALSILGAGVTLCVLSLIGNIVIAVLLTFILGALGGTAWVIGQTLIGLEVSDRLRGRTFAFVQSLVRITLVLILAAGPVIAAAIGAHHIEITDQVNATYNGAAITMFCAGLVAVTVGLISFRQMDDRRGVRVWRDLVAAVRGEPLPLPRPLPGFLIALEGGEGAGKSTQGERLAQRLRADGFEVLLTYEPGATEIGQQLRSVLLDVQTGTLSPRTEALLYAADRAEHVSTVIRPALERGAVVITDRFSDSSIAYQGAGRDLPPAQVSRLSRWATDGLRPDLTVVLDVPPEVGLSRGQEHPDRLESEPDEFHERVRQRYLALAEQTPLRYLVVDATEPPDEVAAQIQTRLNGMLHGLNRTAPGEQADPAALAGAAAAGVGAAVSTEPAETSEAPAEAERAGVVAAAGAIRTARRARGDAPPRAKGAKLAAIQTKLGGALVSLKTAMSTAAKPAKPAEPTESAEPTEAGVTGAPTDEKPATPTTPPAEYAAAPTLVLEPAAEPEPVVEPEPLVERPPAQEAELVTEPQPVAEAQPEVATKTQPAAGARSRRGPAAKAPREAAAEAQPEGIAEARPVAEPQPAAESEQPPRRRHRRTGHQVDARSESGSRRATRPKPIEPEHEPSLVDDLLGPYPDEPP
ncbi:MAG: dTMP kinase [Actinomycetes bacterium]